MVKCQSRTTDITKPHFFEFTTKNFEKITDLKLELIIWCKNNDIKGKKISDYRDVDVDAFGVPMPRYNSSTKTITQLTPKNDKIKIEDGCEIHNEKLTISGTRLMNAIESFTSIPFRTITSNPKKEELYLRVARRVVYSFDEYDDDNTKFRIPDALFVPPQYRQNANRHFKKHILRRYSTGKFKKSGQNHMVLGIPIDGSRTVPTNKRDAVAKKILPIDPAIVEKTLAEICYYVNTLPGTYNLYEKFVIFVLSVHEVCEKIKQYDSNSDSYIETKYSDIKKYAPIFTYVCAKVGAGTDPIVLFIEFFKQYLGFDYVFDPEFFNTEVARKIMSIMSSYDSATTSSAMFDVNSRLSVLIGSTGSDALLKANPFKNSLANVIHEVENISYPSLDKTYKNYVGKHASRRDKMNTNINNLIDSVSFQHSNGVSVTLTNHELIALFGTDFVNINNVIKADGDFRIYCSVRMGVTSDFRDDLDTPVFFDVGNFTATVKFKNQLLVSYGLNPKKIESQLTYKVYGGESIQSHHDMQKNLVDNGVELYRIPIPHRYEITTGPNTTPQNLLVPISSHGSAFGHSISIAEHRYRFKSGLGDIGTYDILIGDLSGEISPDFNYDSASKSIPQLHNKSNTILLKNKDVLFSGPYSKYMPNITVRFKKTDSSKKLKSTATQKISIVPVMECVYKTQWSIAPPGRSFKHITVTNDGRFY